MILQERAAAIHWAKMNTDHGQSYVSGVHDCRYMDVILLDVQSKVWTEPNNPPCTGKLPLARMNHAALNIAGKVIVLGGCYPSTSRVTISDNDVHVLDIESWKWSIPAVENTPFAMLPTLEAAKTAVRRADRVQEHEIASARSAGVPGGKSIEAAEAGAVLTICKWRLRTLQEQVALLSDPPPCRYGHAAVAMGQRIYFVGGFEENKSVGSGKEMVILDLEQADERERRLREEFHARLERERRIQDFQEEQARKQREYEDRVRKEAEMKREREETDFMIFEDMLSRLPPKTIAPTPALQKVRAHANRAAVSERFRFRAVHITHVGDRSNTASEGQQAHHLGEVGEGDGGQPGQLARERQRRVPPECARGLRALGEGEQGAGRVRGEGRKQEGEEEQGG